MVSQTLEKVARVYSECSSCQLAGSIEMRMYSDDWSSELMTQQFSSRFLRPMLMRYEFEQENDSRLHHFCFISDGDSFRLLKTLNGKLQSSSAKPDLKSAIDSCTGISGGLITVVAQLLMPGIQNLLYPPLSGLEEESISKDNIGDELIVRGKYADWSTVVHVKGTDYSISKIEKEVLESESSFKKRVEHMSLARKAGVGGLEDVYIPEDVRLNIWTAYKFEETVFNDSLTVDSIVGSDV